MASGSIPIVTAQTTGIANTSTAISISTRILPNGDSCERARPSSAMPGSGILLVAGGSEAQVDLDIDLLAQRLVERGLDSSELIPEMIPLFVDPERATALAPWLADGSVMLPSSGRAVQQFGSRSVSEAEGLS